MAWHLPGVHILPLLSARAETLSLHLLCGCGRAGRLALNAQRLYRALRRSWRAAAYMARHGEPTWRNWRAHAARIPHTFAAARHE